LGETELLASDVSNGHRKLATKDAVPAARVSAAVSHDTSYVREHFSYKSKYNISADRTKQKFVGYNESPPRDIKINEMNSLRVNPMDTSGSVLMKLNRGDRLLVNTDDLDKTVIEFKAETGATFATHVHTSGLIMIEYTS